MGTEIERKFLVKGKFKMFAIRNYRIVQAYLSSNPKRSVRVRLSDNEAFITVKGESSIDGVSRFEWEKEISIEEAESLLEICEPGTIEKQRYVIPEKNDLFFEVDEFFGLNEGLIIAEIEMPSEDYQISKPEWLAKEVTGNARYYNANLSRNPFSKWKNSSAK